MKRDMDLIRKILLEIGQNESDNDLQEIRIEFYSDEEIAYHAYLLEKAGLIDATVSFGWGTVKPTGYSIRRLTWQGHDFLDACRNEGVWIKAKEKLKSLGGEVSLDVVKTVLIEIITKQVLGT